MVMMTAVVVPAVVVSAVVMSPAVAASIMAAVVPASISTTAPSIPAAVGLSKNRSGQPEHRKDEQYRFDRHVDSCPVSTSVTYLTHDLLPIVADCKAAVPASIHEPLQSRTLRQTMTLAWFYGKSSNF
jgi:hypothetical protein